MRTTEYERVTVNGVRIYKHRAIAEKILGRPLKNEECVHHIDENGLNNENSNLVICPNAAYHKLLHIRAEAYDNFGNVNARRCYLCQKFDETRYMSLQDRGKDSFYYHKKCATKNYKENRERILENRRHRRAAGKAN
jgi:hypothetical protein